LCGLRSRRPHGGNGRSRDYVPFAARSSAIP
jgi:hypothetical protein